MQISMSIRDTVRKGGYTVLAWALNVLADHGQFTLVTMIIVAVCLAPRKTELENNGVLSILHNTKLRRNKNFRQIFEPINPYAYDSGHYDKVVVTLLAAGWWPSNCVSLLHTDPLLETDDNVMFFTPARHGNEQAYPQIELCDLAGTQYERFFGHFRLVWGENSSEVRVIGKQANAWQFSFFHTTILPNGYYEYRIPSSTVINRMVNSLCGRTLSDIMEPGVWYNYHFQPDTELDLVDHTVEQLLANARQGIANAIMKFGVRNG